MKETIQDSEWKKGIVYSPKLSKPSAKLRVYRTMVQKVWTFRLTSRKHCRGRAGSPCAELRGFGHREEGTLRASKYVAPQAAVFERRSGPDRSRFASFVASVCGGDGHRRHAPYPGAGSRWQRRGWRRRELGYNGLGVLVVPVRALRGLVEVDGLTAHDKHLRALEQEPHQRASVRICAHVPPPPPLGNRPP